MRVHFAVVFIDVGGVSVGKCINLDSNKQQQQADLACNMF